MLLVSCMGTRENYQPLQGEAFGLHSSFTLFKHRQGSGSACRSMYGGFVAWERGEREDGSDSLAIQVAPHTHWPELQVIILVVSDQKKPVSSTLGMSTTVQTSSLLKVHFANYFSMMHLIFYCSIELKILYHRE